MEQKKDKPVQRSEQSIQAGKKRREIREENARLQRLREQQKRKAKRRMVKRIDKGLFKRLIITVGALAAVILSMIIFFRVEHIEIRGAVYYTDDEIRNACGVSKGDNLLTLSRGKISGNIMAPFKYVDSVRVSRQLPDTLVIRIQEGDPKYAIADSRGEYYLVTAQGKIMEQIPQRTVAEYALIGGVNIRNPEVGEQMELFVQGEEGGSAQTRLQALLTLLTEIEAAELEREVASIHAPSAVQMSLWYEDRFEVKLGSADRMDYKLEYLKAVIAKEEIYTTGKIDLTLSDGDKAFLLRDE